jgi:hypothetical protein
MEGSDVEDDDTDICVPDACQVTRHTILSNPTCVDIFDPGQKYRRESIGSSSQCGESKRRGFVFLEEEINSLHLLALL